MAPLEGVTVKTFRLCFYEFFPGLSGALTPFLPVPDGIGKVPLRTLSQVSSPGTSPVPELPQLLLSESESFVKACKTLKKAGFTEVNWNLGCPSRGVVRKTKGAGLLPRTDHILRVLDDIFSRTDLEISLKLRLGMEEKEEIYRLLPSLKQFPLKRLILHPRLGSQMYTGSVDLDGFEEARSLYGKKICYNGDIRSTEDLALVKARFPDVDEWMIGRGLLADPLLLERLLHFLDDPGSLPFAPPPHPFTSDVYLSFIDTLARRLKEEFHKENSLWNFMKGVLSYTFALEGTPEGLKNDLKKMQSEEDWKRLRKEMNPRNCQ